MMVKVPLQLMSGVTPIDVYRFGPTSSGDATAADCLSPNQPAPANHPPR